MINPRSPQPIKTFAQKLPGKSKINISKKKMERKTMLRVRK
jgi:hypothetical protein